MVMSGLAEKPRVNDVREYVDLFLIRKYLYMMLNYAFTLYHRDSWAGTWWRAALKKSQEWMTYRVWVSIVWLCIYRLPIYHMHRSYHTGVAWLVHGEERPWRKARSERRASCESVSSGCPFIVCSRSLLALSLVRTHARHATQQSKFNLLKVSFYGPPDYSQRAI